MTHGKTVIVRIELQMLFPQVCSSHRTMHTWFLKIVFAYVSVFVHVSVCPPPRALITSGIWCDIKSV